MTNIQRDVGRGSDGVEAVSLAAENRHELKNATFTPQLRSPVSHTLWMKWRSESRRPDFTTGSLGVAVRVASQPVIDWLPTARWRWEVWLGWQARGGCCNKSRASLRVVCCACGPKKKPDPAWFVDRRWREFCVWVFFFFMSLKCERTEIAVIKQTGALLRDLRHVLQIKEPINRHDMSWKSRKLEDFLLHSILPE